MLNTWIEIYQIRNAATVHHVSHAVKLIGENPTKRRPGRNAAIGHSRSISKFGCKGFMRKIYVVYTDLLESDTCMVGHRGHKSIK